MARTKQNQRSANRGNVPVGATGGRTPPSKATVALLATSVLAAIWAAAMLTPGGRVAYLYVFYYADFYIGVLALVFLSITVMAGVLATDRMMLTVRQRVLLQSAHRTTGVIAVGSLVLHIVIKLSLERVTVIDVFVPFIAANNTAFVGLGTTAAFFMFAVLWTGLVRARFIGRGKPWMWRSLHSTVYLAWPIAMVHGLNVGRAAAGWVIAAYIACVVLVVIALLVRLSVAINRRKDFASSTTTGSIKPVGKLVPTAAPGPRRRTERRPEVVVAAEPLSARIVADRDNAPESLRDLWPEPVAAAAPADLDERPARADRSERSGGADRVRADERADQVVVGAGRRGAARSDEDRPARDGFTDQRYATRGNDANRYDTDRYDRAGFDGDGFDTDRLDTDRFNGSRFGADRVERRPATRAGVPRTRAARRAAERHDSADRYDSGDRYDGTDRYDDRDDPREDDRVAAGRYSADRYAADPPRRRRAAADDEPVRPRSRRQPDEDRPEFVPRPRRQDDQWRADAEERAVVPPSRARRDDDEPVRRYADDQQRSSSRADDQQRSGWRADEREPAEVRRPRRYADDEERPRNGRHSRAAEVRADSWSAEYPYLPPDDTPTLVDMASRRARRAASADSVRGSSRGARRRGADDADDGYWRQLRGEAL